MRGSRFSAVVMVLAVAAGARVGRGAVPLVEDLSGCTLPNGVVTLPAAGKAGAGKGDLLKVSTGTAVVAPRDESGAGLPQDQLLARMRADKTADLLYVADPRANAAPAAAGNAAPPPGMFWAFSGRISDLGGRYLSQAAAMNASRPMEIPATSRGPAGMHPSITEGHTYLLQTTDEHYALLRVLEKNADGVVIQYVYQPAGTLAFAVPESELLEYRREGGVAMTRPAGALPPGATLSGSPTGPARAGASGTGGTTSVGGGNMAAGSRGGPGANGGSGLVASGTGGRPPTTLPAPAPRTGLGPGDMYEPGTGGRIVLLNGAGERSGAGAPSGAAEPGLESFVKQRDAMIQHRMALVQAPARTPVEVERKAQAIQDLAELRAEEAADTLATHIGFLNARSNAREFTPDAFHPAFAALKRLGKPASRAALRGLGSLTHVDAPGEGIESPAYRAGLLMQVLRAVEGDDVADFLVRREMEKATDPQLRAVYENLLVKK